MPHHGVETGCILPDSVSLSSAFRTPYTACLSHTLFYSVTPCYLLSTLAYLHSTLSLCLALVSNFHIPSLCLASMSNINVQYPLLSFLQAWPHPVDEGASVAIPKDKGVTSHKVQLFRLFSPLSCPQARPHPVDEGAVGVAPCPRLVPIPPGLLLAHTTMVPGSITGHSTLSVSSTGAAHIPSGPEKRTADTPIGPTSGSPASHAADNPTGPTSGSPAPHAADNPAPHTSGTPLGDTSGNQTRHTSSTPSGLRSNSPASHTSGTPAGHTTHSPTHPIPGQGPIKVPWVSLWRYLVGELCVASHLRLALDDGQSPVAVAACAAISCLVSRGKL